MRNWMIAGSLLATGTGMGAGCATVATEYVVRGSDRSVGVDGVIGIHTEREDVNVVSVELVNLPPPERHDPTRRAFVVWITPTDGGVIKAGRLAYDADSRKGVLHATTPNDEVFVQVTIEENSAVTQPSEFVLISKNVMLKRVTDSAGL